MALPPSVYSPGAGHRPPVLAGRDPLLQHWRLMLNDVGVQGRRRATDLVLTGARGVGKTATVSAFSDIAREQHFEVVELQAAAGAGGLVGGLLQLARERIDAEAGPWQRARRALERLGGAGVTVAGVGANLAVRPPDAQSPREMVPGDLATVFTDLAREVRSDHAHGGLMITVDELQVATAPDLALLAAALHRLNVNHPDAVVVFAGTGLPHLSNVLRDAGVTHPDRLFDLREIPLTLQRDDARYAIVEAARQVGVSWQPGAVDVILRASRGYPAHLQTFAHATWQCATGVNEITVNDAQVGVEVGAAEIERRTLGPRWDRMPDRQIEFLIALAINGGRAPTATVAATLGRSQQALSTLRQDLIDEGDIFVPRRGEVALALPLLGRYILARYDEARAAATVNLLTLEEMSDNNPAVELPSPSQRSIERASDPGIDG
ncbi:MAG: AAA family ATPase [Solirubrobacteraceae bacterium]